MWKLVTRSWINRNTNYKNWREGSVFFPNLCLFFVFCIEPNLDLFQWVLVERSNGLLHEIISNILWQLHRNKVCLKLLVKDNYMKHEAIYSFKFISNLRNMLFGATTFSYLIFGILNFMIMCTWYLATFNNLQLPNYWFFLKVCTC